MKKLNRIMATVSAQFSDLVDQVENHEAVAASALKRFRSEIQEAKVQVRLLEKDLEQAENSCEEARKNMDLWKVRAKREAQTNEDKALECVQRYSNSKKEVDFWQDKVSQTKKQLDDLKSSLRQIECKYEGMKLELQKYVARDRKAKVQSQTLCTGQSGNHCEDSLGDVFRRWDRRLISDEVNVQVNSQERDQNIDDFALEMQAQEETENLKTTLKEIIEE